MTLEDKNVNFTENFRFEHLINESNSFKESRSCTDLIMTYRKSYFKNTCLTVTRISNFSLKYKILKAIPKMKTYRNQKTFDKKRFSDDVKSKLESIGKLDYMLFHWWSMTIKHFHWYFKYTCSNIDCEQIITNLWLKLSGKPSWKDLDLKMSTGKLEMVKTRKTARNKVIFAQIYSKNRNWIFS